MLNIKDKESNNLIVLSWPLNLAGNNVRHFIEEVNAECFNFVGKNILC